MSMFWNWWIVGLVGANIVFALWLLLSTTRRKSGDQSAGPETTGHVWDGDLREYNNPLPRWWLGMFYLSIAFGLVYLALYPGLGAFRGILGWSGVSQWKAQSEEMDVVYARAFARFDDMTIDALRGDPGAMQVAYNLYAANCAMCHGSDGRGAKGFPNLASPNLSWGREPDAVTATISGGRQGVMPAWKDVIGADGVKAVASYVYSLSGHAAPAALVEAGKDKFATFCVACHGPEGKGNTLLGAPNLTDAVWIYGGSLSTIEESIANGRANRMPAHGELLGERKVRLLAAYVLSLAPAPRLPRAAGTTAAAGG